MQKSIASLIAKYVFAAGAVFVWFLESHYAAKFIEGGCKTLDAAKGCVVQIKTFSGIGYISLAESKTLDAMRFSAIAMFIIALMIVYLRGEFKLRKPVKE